MKCFSECQCGGDGYIERGPSGATYSYPCYPWDCKVPNCRCKTVGKYNKTEEIHGVGKRADPQEY